MAHEIAVRPATIGDLDLVAQDGLIPREEVERKIGRNEVVVAVRGQKGLGYARIEFLWSIVPFLSLVWVLRGHRHEGVGKAILAHLESRFRQEGHAAFYSSSQGNEAEPQAWHRHMGFEECGFISGINEGGIGEVLFRKALSSD